MMPPDTIPKDPLRRCDTAKMSPAELAIYEAMIAVEKAGADTRLTRAVILLGEARDRVADFVDGVRPIP